MEELIKTIEKNKRLFFVALGALMFVFIAFCPAVDVAGKATANGFKVLFDGSGLGFSRFVMFLLLIDPLAVIVCQFVELKLGDLNTLLFAIAIVLFVILAIALPQGLSVTIGAYLYLLFSLIGVGSCYLLKSAKK